MAMVQIGIMRVAMYQRLMSMPVRMGLAWGCVWAVLVLVVLVVIMPVLVLHRFVGMLVFVSLGQM